MYGNGWLDYMARAEDVMSLAWRSSPFNEKRQGLCRTNTADDRKRRKEVARELTRRREAELAVKRLRKTCDGCPRGEVFRSDRTYCM